MPHLPRAVTLVFAALAACGRADARSAAAGAADVRAPAPSATPATAVAAPAGAPDPRVVRADRARIMGDANAKLWVVVISDFQCPFCKQWMDSTEMTFRKEFVETGKVRMAYVHFPLSQHQNSMPAAEASMCAAAQDHFWPYHDRLFASVQDWGGLRDPHAVFERLAQETGLDLAAYRTCIKDHVMLPMIRADYERASASGASSTPTFRVGSLAFAGAQPIEIFRRAIAQEMSGASK
jgi:protein-disulfide isomerase